MWKKYEYNRVESRPQLWRKIHIIWLNVGAGRRELWKRKRSATLGMVKF